MWYFLKSVGLFVALLGTSMAAAGMVTGDRSSAFMTGAGGMMMIGSLLFVGAEE